MMWARRDPTRAARWPWQAQRLREPGSLLDSNKEESILYLFYLKSKQFLLSLMSKRFHKLCRENMTHLHLGDFQPGSSTGGVEKCPSSCLTHTLPQLPGGGQGSGGCSWSGLKGSSQEEESLVRMEPFSLSHVQSQHG